jgi:predicted esterase
MTRYFLMILLTTLIFSGCQKESTEIDSLKKWLAESSGSSIELLNQPFAQKKLSKEEAETSIQLLHPHFQNKLKEEFTGQWNDSTLILGEYELKFRYKKFGQKPADGWSLYISMHGGGNTRPEMNNHQWQNQIGLYEPGEGIYMASRAPTDSWNMWHQSHVDDLFDLFIQLADVFEGINFNRVYLTGYSAGGDGVYQLAPRMADRFAAAAMMAGHPNDASPLGLRNLPFTLHMGAEDAAYNRNKVAQEWGVKLDELQQNDPGGYIHNVQIHEGLGHWMEQKDTVAIEWMAQFFRNPWPEKVVWKQSSTTHTRFYWLGVPAEEAQKDAELVVSRQGQTIRIEKAENVKTLRIFLSDEMIDPDKKVTVEFDEKVLYDEVPKRTISTIWESLSERNDPQQVFSAQIEVSLI